MSLREMARRASVPAARNPADVLIAAYSAAVANAYLALARGDTVAAGVFHRYVSQRFHGDAVTGIARQLPAGAAEQQVLLQRAGPAVVDRKRDADIVERQLGWRDGFAGDRSHRFQTQ